MGTIFYVSNVLYWLFFSLRARSFAFFASSNPLIRLGGFFNYSKFEILKFIPEKYLPKTTVFNIPEDSPRILSVINSSLSFPLVIKPDQGERGRGVKIISNLLDLERTLGRLPYGKYLAQEFIDYKFEIGVMYVRIPGNAEGKITSIAIKNIGEDRIGNICHGTSITDAGNLNSFELQELIEELSRKIPEFYFGRYDIKVQNICESPSRWVMKIIEINGANSQPLHVFAKGNNLFKRLKITFTHWLLLFKISRINHNRGVSYPSIWKIIQEISIYIKRNHNLSKMIG